jgi:hypothetical protein
MDRIKNLCALEPFASRVYPVEDVAQDAFFSLIDN